MSDFHKICSTRFGPLNTLPTLSWKHFPPLSCALTEFYNFCRLKCALQTAIPHFISTLFRTSRNPALSFHSSELSRNYTPSNIFLSFSTALCTIWQFVHAYGRDCLLHWKPDSLGFRFCDTSHLIPKESQNSLLPGYWETRRNTPIYLYTLCTSYQFIYVHYLHVFGYMYVYVCM